MDFLSAYAHGFARVAACTVPVAVADPQANAAAVLLEARRCHDEAVALAVFPELCLSGCTAGDLHLADPLLRAVDKALAEVVRESQALRPVLVVGAPLRHAARLLDCAVVVHRGRVLGVVPRSSQPSDLGLFAPGGDVRGETVVAGQRAPLGPDLLFEAEDVPGLVVHVEVGDDLGVPVPPSATAALAGATVLVNLAGSPVTVGHADDRRLLARSASARCLAVHVYATAGQGESSTDLAWDGQTMVHEVGDLLAEGPRFHGGPVRTVADVDLDRVRQERLRAVGFEDNRRALDVAGFRHIGFRVEPPVGDVGLRRQVRRFPFVPDDPARLARDCDEVYNIQVTALVRRLRAIGEPKVVIGVSGGLDSTHALIVAAEAMDRLGRPRSDILAFTLPGFATSEATLSSALALMDALGTTGTTIDIRPAARQMLADLGHPFAEGEPVYDVTFENVQAGLRTDYLFRAANQRGGIVLGTGDLSELALGWCTYGVGDHMSHYGVNAGVPKTLLQHLVRWVIDQGTVDAATAQVLATILDQEISPELVPVAAGERPQATQDVVGPYVLQDFTLFYVLRHGSAPSTIAFLAWHAWRDADAGSWPPGWPADRRTAYDLATIRGWLLAFVRRFFANQFKRTAMPDGPTVISGGSLSPRGGWRMPSDASPATWLAEIEENVPLA
ncbi:MAG: NAD(+) synthase [Micrococcales bacterium]|nr:NAD(+) synthase [Micrococcales bacterium]